MKILTEIISGIGYLKFNRPDKHNAITLDMWIGIGEIIDRYASDDRVHVVVLSGEGGRAFSSGADISQFDEQRSSSEHVDIYNNALDEACRKLSDIDKPTLASIQGYAMGGGLAISICCDLRIATPDSVFAIPAAKLGVGYAYESLAILTRLVGPAFAKEIMFTGRRFSAQEAHDMGLINRCVAATELQAVTNEYAETLATNAPLTIKACKRIIADLGKDPNERDIDACNRLVDDCFRSEDYQEGRQAFLEKRPPRFRGN